MVLPGRKLGFRAGFWLGKPDPENREPKVGRRADVEAFPIKICSKPGPEARLMTLNFNSRLTVFLFMIL